MPDDSRLWIYQANRKFTTVEKDLVERSLKAMCENWSAHGAPLQTSFTIRFDQFIILVVDERNAGASGCSIDGSVRLLKSLQQEIGIDFFDRETVCFEVDQAILSYPLAQVKTLFEQKALSGNTITFNNALATKATWTSQWKIAAKDTWLVKYLPKRR